MENVVRDSEILVVCDPNLGEEGIQILRRNGLAHLTILKWVVGDRESRRAASRTILAKHWPVCVSFYSEFIFTQAELDCIGVPINIHPSLDPGMGYDTYPLVYDHPTHGALVHFMIEQVDAGPIVKVNERPLARSTTYAEIRKTNQQLCLEMIDWFAKQIATAADEQSFKNDLLRMHRELGRAWGPRYISVKERDGVLAELFRTNPQHRVFQGHPGYPAAQS